MPRPDRYANVKAMDLANHHIAHSMQSYDAMHAERVNEYRRIAEERRAEEPTTVPSTEPLWYRAWYRFADAVTLHHYRGHSHAH